MKQYWSEAVNYGKEEGKLQTALAVLPILLSQGKTIEEVAVICDVSVEKLKEIYKNQNQNM